MLKSEFFDLIKGKMIISCQELKDNADMICGCSWENGISGALKELKLV